MQYIGRIYPYLIFKPHKVCRNLNRFFFIQACDATNGITFVDTEIVEDSKKNNILVGIVKIDENESEDEINSIMFVLGYNYHLFRNY